MSLVSLPQETLHEILALLAAEAGSHALLAACLTCKALYPTAAALLYRDIALEHHSRLIDLLRTLVARPDLRGAIRCLQIRFILRHCDSLMEDYSVREYYLNEAPGRDTRYDWDLQHMDAAARDAFKQAGLDCAEFRAYDDDELAELNDGTYWLVKHAWSQRLDREERLVQCIVLAVICLAGRLAALHLWLEVPTSRSSMWHLELHSLNHYIESIVKDETKTLAPALVRLVIEGGCGEGEPGERELAALRKLVLGNTGGVVERCDSEEDEGI